MFRSENNQHRRFDPMTLLILFVGLGLLASVSFQVTALPQQAAVAMVILE